MKKWILVLFLIKFSIASAQKECEYNTNVTDSLGTYKSTKEYLVQERFFGGSEKSMFFSLIDSGEFPSLSIKVIQKSTDFLPAVCLDENSKVYFQLENGKIITLISINDTNCGNSVRVDDKNCRILTGYFIFMKDTYEELKKSPISLMRIKYSSETLDYIMKQELVSEADKTIYSPANYFINYLKCVE